jgi:hypothetical protein
MRLNDDAGLLMAAETLLLKAVDYALQFLRGREVRSEQERELRTAFLEAFRDALVRTRSCIADQRDGVAERHRATELKLSRAWNQVGIRVQSLPGGEELNQLYFAKADYWSDPSQWEHCELSKVDISLERAESEAKKLLAKA